MIAPGRINFMWKAFLFSLLLTCSLVYCQNSKTTFTSSGIFEGLTYNSSTHLSFQVTGSSRVTIELKGVYKYGGSYLSILMNIVRVSPYPPITLSVTDFTLSDSYIEMFHPVSPNTMINFTRGTGFGITDKNYHYLSCSLTTSTGFTLYLTDITGTYSTTNPGPLIVLGVYGLSKFDNTTDRNRTGVYMTRMTANNAKSLLAHARYTGSANDVTTGTVHYDTISVTDSSCNNCDSSFYLDNSTNLIENRLLRLLNCTHDSTAPFYQQLSNSLGGEEYLQLRDNGNLILSNVTTNGPLFGYTPNNNGMISSTARVTLFNITAKSLYRTSTSSPLFPSVPNGAQVYVGSMKLNGKTYSSLSDYQGLKLPFTRVIDVNRKTLFVASGRPNTNEVLESSKVGELSASYCVNDGYEKVALRMDPSSKAKKTMCICNADRFVPHCTTSYDPLGESLCPTRTSVSETTYQCIPCDIDYCDTCTVANKCAVCYSGYVIDDQNKCTIPAANCKVPVSGSSTQCSVCNSGYSVSVGKKCVQSISNCKTYTDSGVCTSCQGTLSPSLSGASCVDCTMAGCIVCHADSKCTTCETKYSLVNDKCVSCDLENCVRCEEHNRCKECEDRFKVSGANCVKKTCDKPPCTSCTTLSGDEDICLGCTSPHVLNSSSQQCDACIDNYKLNDDNACIEKTCAKPPCTGCDSPSGNTDTCKSCPSPLAVNPSTQQCDACIDNYKMGDDDVCIEKTCAKPPSMGCNSVSGNEDISVGCTSPHQLNPSTQQCDACIDNYKMGDDDVCIEKTCAKPPSMGCNSVSGNEDISVGCTSPHQLNPSTQQCDACIDNYKMGDDDVCIEKTCAKPPSMGCNSVSGNEDISVGCTSPHQLNPSTQQCDACIDNYKMGDDDVCIEKTCAKPPSMGCNSVSGNEDISVGCTSPHQLNPSTQQCDACIDNYKMGDDDVCIEKTCAKPPSTGCNSVAGNEDISVGCTSPHQLNPSTQQCDACIDNYKMGDDDVCIEKTCAKPPSTGCNSVAGNEDISVGCASPHILNSSTQQCDACEPGLKYIQENVTCVEKQCLVANCSKCVFDQEHQCDSCGDGLQVDGDSQCSAVKDEKKVSTGMLIGIIIAVIAVIIIAVLLVFFLCCRKPRRSYETVEHVKMKNMPAVKGNDLPSVEVEEETEVTIIKPDGEGDERNPLLPTEEANEPPTVSGGRRTRRARNVRRTQAEIADVDLDAMYSKDNEIQEDIF